MCDNTLSRHCERLRDAWLESIWASYPEESLRLFRDSRDRFANPVGAVYRRSAEKLVEGLLGSDPVEELHEHLEPMIRVRAVQELKPSEAVGLISHLKELAPALQSADHSEAFGEEELARFGRRVDQLLLLAFDIYMNCREEVFSIRVKEIRNRSLKTMERLNEWREKRHQKKCDAADVD